MNSDMGETARIILMDDPYIPLNIFACKMREVHPGISVEQISKIFITYRGCDRIAPTHDIVTGELLK